MTEKEKCHKGLLYNANYDKELIAERNACKILCDEYNRLAYIDAEEKNDLMRKILGSVGEGFLINQPFWCDYGYNIKMGNNFYSNYNLVILDGARVTFGDNVFIGPNCAFYTAGHPLNVKQRNEGLEYAKPIKVGNNVWFGGNVVVLPGVTIGNNCTIGAGSVVTRSLADNIVAVGNPCRVIKRISE